MRNNRFRFKAWDSNRKQMVTDFMLGPTSPTWGAFLIRGDNPEVNNLINDFLKEPIGGHFTLTDWSDYYGLENYTVLQSTGLYDKNGNEIYEGDILQFKFYHIFIKWWSSVEEIPKIEKTAQEGRENFYIRKEQVKWNEGSFHISYLYLHEISNLYKDDKITLDNFHKNYKEYNCNSEKRMWDFEIVGNVFENLDLLES